MAYLHGEPVSGSGDFFAQGEHGVPHGSQYQHSTSSGYASGYPSGYSPSPSHVNVDGHDPSLSGYSAGGDLYLDPRPGVGGSSAPSATEVVKPNKSPTPTEKYQAFRDRKYAEETGHMPNARDRYGNPKHVPLFDTNQPYFVDQYGKMHPLPTDANGNPIFPGGVLFIVDFCVN